MKVNFSKTAIVSLFYYEGGKKFLDFRADVISSISEESDITPTITLKEDGVVVIGDDDHEVGVSPGEFFFFAGGNFSTAKTMALSVAQAKYLFNLDTLVAYGKSLSDDAWQKVEGLLYLNDFEEYRYIDVTNDGHLLFLVKGPLATYEYVKVKAW